jgi:hypothetical protein
MEREGLSLDRRLFQVFVAAIDMEIAAAEAGELENVMDGYVDKGESTFILIIASSGWSILN